MSDLVDAIDLSRQQDPKARAMMGSVVAEAWARTGQGKKAADTIIRVYLEMLVTAADESPAQDLAHGLLVADQALNNGANKPAITKAFKDRGLMR